MNTPYVFEEHGSDGEWCVPHTLQLAQQLRRVKLVQSLEVAEDYAAFAAQRLWKVVARHGHQVNVESELERSNVVTLRVDHLRHESCQQPERTQRNGLYIIKNEAINRAYGNLINDRYVILWSLEVVVM